MHKTIILLTLLWVATPGLAQVAKQANASDQALKKAQGMLRQLNDEKLALTSEKSALQQQVQQLQDQVKQLAELQAELAQQRAGAESLRAANQSITGQVQRLREQESDLGRKLQESLQQNKALQGDNQQLLAMVKEREQAEQACVGNNQQLIAAGEALAKQHGERSFWELFGELEPLTGIGKVATETAVQDYRFKLEDLRVTPAAPGANAN